MCGSCTQSSAQLICMARYVNAVQDAMSVPSECLAVGQEFQIALLSVEVGCRLAKVEQ